MKTDTNGAQQEGERQRKLDSTERWLFSEQLWGIEHALCWIAMRDRKAMAEYFADNPPTNFEEMSRPIHSLRKFLQTHKISCEASLTDLQIAARQGVLTIEGKGPDNVWKPIPPGDWSGGPSPGGLWILEGSGRGPYAASSPLLPTLVLTELRVHREQVTSAFQADAVANTHWFFPTRPWWQRSAGETIDDIIGDAVNGHLEPSEVAAIALAKGLRDPLSTWKEGSADIFAESHWNFAMAIAWICWRTEDVVRGVWPSWLQHHYYWRTTSVDQPGPDGTRQRVQGWYPEPFSRSHATVLRLRDLEDSSKPEFASPLVSLNSAIDDLLSRLRAGDVQAVGRGENIPREQWQALAHDGYRDGPHHAGTDRQYACDWEILILRSEILKLWRETAAQVRKPRGRPNVAGEQAEREIEKMRAEGVDVLAMGEKVLAKALKSRGVEATPRTAGRAKARVKGRTKGEHK